MTYDRLEIPELLIEFYRGDTAVRRILLTATSGEVTATSGSDAITTTSDELIAGYNLYTANGVFIGTVATVGSGTATLMTNATFSYSGELRVGIGWETAVSDAVCSFVRVGGTDAVLSASLGDGITFDGDWFEIDFTALETAIRADRYTGDLRVKLLDDSVMTLIKMNVVTFVQNRSEF